VGGGLLEHGAARRLRDELGRAEQRLEREQRELRPSVLAGRLVRPDEDRADLPLGERREPPRLEPELRHAHRVGPDERAVAVSSLAREQLGELEEAIDGLAGERALPPAQRELGDVARVELLDGLRRRGLRAEIDEVPVDAPLVGELARRLRLEALAAREKR